MKLLLCFAFTLSLGAQVTSIPAATGSVGPGTPTFPETDVTSATHTILTTNCYKTMNFSRAGGIAVTLPDPASFTDGCTFFAKNTGAGDVVITADTGIALNGVTAGSITIPQGQGGIIVTDAVAWKSLYTRRVCSSGITCSLDPGTGVESITAATDTTFETRRFYSHTFWPPSAGDTTTKTSVFDGWVSSGGSGVLSNSAYTSTANWSDEQGYGLTTNATNTHNGGFMQSVAPTGAFSVAGLNAVPTNGWFKFRCKFVVGSDVTDMRLFCRFGDGANPMTALAQTNSFGLTLDTGVSANFRVQACQASSCKYIDTGLAPAASKRYEFIAISTTSDVWSWYIYVDGTLTASGANDATLDTTPSAAMYGSIEIVTLENVSKSLWAQRFEYEQKDR